MRKTETGAQLSLLLGKRYEECLIRTLSRCGSMRRRFTKVPTQNHKPPHLNCTALLRSGSIRCSHQNASAISGIRRPVRC